MITTQQLTELARETGWADDPQVSLDRGVETLRAYAEIFHCPDIAALRRAYAGTRRSMAQWGK